MLYVIIYFLSSVFHLISSYNTLHVQYFSSGLWCCIYCLLFLELGSLLSQFMQYIYSIFHLDCDIVFVYHLLFLEVVVSLNQIILTIHIIQYFQSGLWCCILSRLIYYGVLYSKSYLVFDVVFHHTLFLQLLLLFITSFIHYFFYSVSLCINCTVFLIRSVILYFIIWSFCNNVFHSVSLCSIFTVFFISLYISCVVPGVRYSISHEVSDLVFHHILLFLE